VPGSSKAKVQVLRSADRWSTGTNESSILNAYVHTIENSEHYIYIENQFFCSDVEQEHSLLEQYVGPPVKIFNGIAKAILQKIGEKMKAKEEFRVVIVIPAHPDGPLHVNPAVKVVLYGTLMTLFGSKGAIVPSVKDMATEYKLEEHGLHWQDYISVNSLWTHAKFPADPKHQAQMVYVHSKVMIVDDRFSIIGSANINDRSQEGDRDSEMAVVVDSLPEQRQGRAGVHSDRRAKAEKTSWPVTGGFAHSLRVHLWAEHLGMLEPDGTVGPQAAALLENPTSKECYKDQWCARGKQNQQILSEVFPYVPSDRIRTMALYAAEAITEQHRRASLSKADDKTKCGAAVFDPSCPKSMVVAGVSGMAEVAQAGVNVVTHGASAVTGFISDAIGGAEIECAPFGDFERLTGDNGVRGHLCEYPSCFLADDYTALVPGPLTKEGVANSSFHAFS